VRRAERLALARSRAAGGDARLFHRVAQAYSALRNGSGSGGGAPVPPAARPTREDAPGRWASPEQPGSSSKRLRLEADPPLEAALRVAAETRRHADVLHAYPGRTWDARGCCDADCLLHLRPAPAPSKAVLCDRHGSVHACTPDLCCGPQRLCATAVLCLARQARSRPPAAPLSPEQLARHACRADGCTWSELRLPGGASSSRRVFLCGASGRPHICTPSQCRSGREARVLDERGGLARQWRCAISGMGG